MNFLNFGKRTNEDSTVVLSGTQKGLNATGVYVDLVSGLKARIVILERNQILLIGLAVLLSLALVLAMPLKHSVPYFYEVDSSSGYVGLSSRVAQELDVSDKNIAYFLRLWTARLVTINAATLKEGIPSAYSWTRGTAQVQLDNWTGQEDKTGQRIGKTPGLTRQIIGIPTVSFNEDRNIAFIDFVVAEHINGKESLRQRKLLTVQFGLLSDQSEAAEDPDNPLGVAIDFFTIQDQL